LSCNNPDAVMDPLLCGIGHTGEESALRRRSSLVVAGLLTEQDSQRTEGDTGFTSPGRASVEDTQWQEHGETRLDSAAAEENGETRLASAAAEEKWLRDHQTKPAKRLFLLVLGSVTLLLGLVGIVIPVLPTTPFLLVSAWSWLRSSKRLYQWLMRNRVLGAYIRNYLIHKAVTHRARRLALLFLWAGLGGAFWLVDSLHIRIVLMVVGVAVSIHLLTLRTIREENAHAKTGTRCEKNEA